MPGITLMIDQIGRLQRFALVGALIAVIVFFALFAPGFARVDNLSDVLLNNFALLAIASLGMTLVLSLGAIDLSLGVSIDVASLAFVLLSAHHVGVVPAALGGVACRHVQRRVDRVVRYRTVSCHAGHALHWPDRSATRHRRRSARVSAQYRFATAL
jgi:hypothetical protein